VSWLSLEDALSLVLQALRDERMAGPLDAVSPRPVTQRELAATLGRVLGRPARMPMPGALLRGALGQMAQEMLLGSTRVRPSTLESLDFAFEHPDLESALRCELGREA
jgi:NAD dependent epimerase/dehydratase family enzyme